MGSSYIPLPPWALLFCYAPLWISVLHEKSWKKVFLKAWLAQVTLTLIGFHWIAFVAHEFGFFPWPVAVLILLLFAAFIHLYIPTAVLAAWTLQRRWRLKPWAFFLSMAVLFSLGESLWPSLFPWNLGYSYLPWNLPIVQLADVFGFLGLSFLTYLANAFLANVGLKYSTKPGLETRSGILLKPAAYVIFFFLALNFLGWLRKAQVADLGGRNLKILQVQGNIGNLERLEAEKSDRFDKEISEKYFQLTRLGLAQNAQADMVIWPEAAFPDFLGSEQALRTLPTNFRNFVRDIKKPILTGAFDIDPSGTTRRQEYNALYFFNDKGETEGPSYKKTYLLAFGEYTPFADRFPGLAKLSPAGTGFGRGPGPTLINSTTVRIGPQICYEGLYPEFSAKLSLLGAQMIVNLTNDSWFGHSFEPWQNLYMTLARALETRLPVVRSTNTGVTSAIQADGTMLTQSNLGQEWFGLFEVRISENPKPTLYTRFGKFLPVFLVFLLFGALYFGKNNATR